MTTSRLTKAKVLAGLAAQAHAQRLLKTFSPRTRAKAARIITTAAQAKTRAAKLARTTKAKAKRKARDKAWARLLRQTARAVKQVDAKVRYRRVHAFARAMGKREAELDRAGGALTEEAIVEHAIERFDQAFELTAPHPD